MANRKSSITAELKLAGLSGFKTGLKDVGAAGRMAGKELSSISIDSGRMRSSMMNVKSSILMAGGAAVAAGAAFKSAFAKDLNVEQLAMALSSVSDGTETLAKQFTELREAAKLPGLGFSEIAKGSLDLQSVGVSAKTSRDVIIQLGNALASTGKGKAELDGITTALSQMYGKGKVSAEEINQIAERYPAIRSIAASLDKSSPSKFTEGLAEALSKLPRATGTAKDSIDNLSDAYDQFMTGKTGGGINNFVKDLAEGTANAINSNNGLADSFEKLGKGVRNAFTDRSGGKGMLEKYELSPEEINKRQQAKQKSAENEIEVRDKLLQAQIDLADAESSIAKARAFNDDNAILQASTELALLKEKQKLIEETGATEEHVVNTISRRVAIEQASLNITRDAERSKQRTKESRELSEMEAKAGGMSDRRFKKLKKSNDLKSEEERLIAEGRSPEEAKALAARIVGAESRINENEERASRGLRPKIRTITDKSERERNRFGRISTGDKSKLENLSHSESAEETFSRKEKGGIGAYMGDDPMDIRPQQSNLRKPIIGAGSKNKQQDGGNDKPESGWQMLIKAMQNVEKAIKDGSPSRSDRTKPQSTNNRG